MTAAVVDITVTDGAAERKLALGTAFHSVLAANFRQKIVKWRHFEPAVILCAVRWYLRYSLSCRDVRELLVEPKPKRTANREVRIESSRSFSSAAGVQQRIYPFFAFDDLTSTRADQTWNVVSMENA